MSDDRSPAPTATATVDLQPLQLLPLGRVTVQLRKPFVLDTCPSGTKWIFEVESGRLTGGPINATMKGHANADWLTIGPDGTGTLDVRSLMQTDDGALIFVHYYGRVDLASGRGGTLYSAPQFDTGDERYRWLNKVQAVGKGRFDGTQLTYDLYQLA